MKRTLLLVTLALFWLAAALVVIAQDKVTLQYKAQKGQKMTYRLEADLSSEFGGQKINVLIKQTSVDEILDVSASGEITRQSVDEEVELTVNGQKMPAPEQVSKRRTITVTKPDGTLVSVRWEGGDEPTEAERKSQMRLMQSTQIVFPPNPVGVGDKWTREYKEDAEKGTPNAVAEYELLALEKTKGVDTAKLRYVYRETGREKPLTLRGEVWVEVASGDIVVLNLQAENFPFAPSEQAPTFSGTLRAERTGGSPIGGTAAAAQPAEAPKKKEKTIEEVVKDFEKIGGVFILYRKKEAGKDTIYLEIREDQLDKLLLLQVTQSTGTGGYALAAGNPIDDILFKFVRRDEQILMVVPNIRFRADERQPIARAVRRSFADAYLEAFRIEARSEERKSLLINVSDLFRSDIAQITRLAQAAGGAYSIDREKTVISAIKNFPNNLVVQTAYHLTRAGGGGGGSPFSVPGMPSSAPLADPRSLPLNITYNLFFLPENGYRPRLADPRVGYFVTEFQDFTKDEEDQIRRYILRWHLEKADPDAPMSPPKEPIVFWLDNAIPTEYRDAVREGILWWNKAFERIGFKDAIVVKQMPDDADWDHADMRYNVIRWVTSPSSGYAVALFRANPLTGQILNASITVDANMTRFARVEFQRMINPLSAFDQEPHHHHHPFLCDMAEETAYHAWFGMTAMRLLQSPQSTRVSETEYVKQYIREVVAHEMGHILGLRHNFVASTLHAPKDLTNAEPISQLGMTASVMEYTPVNIFALRSPRSLYWTPGLGVYDYWAIEYGYKPSKAKTPEAELPMLRAIARRGTERGLTYMGDEFADSVDPYITRFDLGKDPLEYWATIFRDVNRMIPQLPSKAVKPGENYYELTRAFNGLMSMYARAANNVARFVGGVRLRPNHKGDPNERPPVEPLSATEQRRALRLLTEYVFSPRAFNFPKEVYLRLAPDPYPDYASFLTAGRPRLDAPVRDLISGIQTRTLRRLFSEQTLSQIANNEFKAGKPGETLTLTELFAAVSNAVNAEVINGTNIPPLRRLLQRTYLRTLSDMLLDNPQGVPDDARMLARYHLRQLRAQIVAVRSKPLDAATRVHLDEMLSEIDRVLNAQYTVGVSEPPAAASTPRR